MKKRGIRVMPGGDYGFAVRAPVFPTSDAADQFGAQWTPHGTYRDPELFVKRLGYTPMEAILAATALGGELLLHPEELVRPSIPYRRARADLSLVYRVRSSLATTPT